MSTQFELRFIGAEVPDGQLDAEDLLALVASLQQISTRLGRREVDAPARGRPSREVGRLANLRVGLDAGSTRLLFSRATDTESLDFDLGDEAAVDKRFDDLIVSIAKDERPDWVTDSIAEGAESLATAMKRTAPTVEFSVGGEIRVKFSTDSIRRETWRPEGQHPAADEFTLIGRLEKVDISRHDFRVRDDVGNEYSLPRVHNDTEVMHLIGSHVRVSGRAELNKHGQIHAIRDAQIEEAPQIPTDWGVPGTVPIDAILASASGPSDQGIPGLTDEEANAFFEALQT